MQTARVSVLPRNEEATRRYYDRNARTYSEVTARIDMSAVYHRFLRHVPPGGLILDAGSGSGRDTVALIERGYEVEAFDSSPELCELSTQLTGIRTRILRFQEFESPPRYDGVWACASLLHVPQTDLHDAIKRLTKALKPGGVLYMSFKLGSGERIADDGRFYTDMDEQNLRELFTAFPDMALIDIWISAGEGTLHGKDAWLNAIALKPSESHDR